MEIETIALATLHAHPHNSNVMPPDLFAKLVKHLERTGRYPPVIVRRLKGGSSFKFQEFQVSCPPATDTDRDNTKPETAIPQTSDPKVNHYQILDGHHRVEALRQLGRREARCVVWDVDDQEALLLLATLNRLQGGDDPRKRGALLAKLREGQDLRALGAMLPDARLRLERLLVLADRAPQPRPGAAADHLPVAVYFFLMPEQKRALEARLSAIGGPREAALMSLVA